MLNHIHIRDFAIVDELELELTGGMTCLTGETGAGKSILVDALGLLLGDRAEASWVRHGTDKAEIAGSFSIENLAPVQAWLEDQDLVTDEPECQLRRVIHREGRSRAYINGSPAPLQSLRALGELLVDIHGQHEHQSLVRHDIQRDMLDGFGNHDALLKTVREHYQAWRAAQDEWEQLRAVSAERDSRLEFVRFQVEELEALGLAEGELAELEEEHGRLANSGQLMDNCQSSLHRLYEADASSAHDLISLSLAEIEALAALDPALKPIQELLTDTQIQVQEAAEELRRYSDHLEQDPQRLQWVEQRLGTIHDLARKHRVKPGTLPGLLEQLQEELLNLDNADQRLGALETQAMAHRDAYLSSAGKLHTARNKAARTFARRISAAMQELGMAGGVFEVTVTPREDDKLTVHGTDRIEFRVSANPGQPPMSLGKVASGGELSRISLAIQVIAADNAHIPTLIFDEVDTGVGGGVAETVGRQLRALGEQRQVLCVTHLPQVAAQAHHHLQVSKLSGDNTTRTCIRPLGDDERLDEVARMLGGIEITASTRQHAQEMIEKAQGVGKKRVRKKS